MVNENLVPGPGRRVDIDTMQSRVRWRLVTRIDEILNRKLYHLPQTGLMS